MRGLWTKIGLGALGVFLVGMLFLTLVRQARTAVTETLSEALHRAHGTSTSFSATEAAQVQDRGADFAFRLDGERLGTVDHLAVRRTATNAAPSVDLDVTLTSPDGADLLRDCILIPVDRQDLGFDHGFRCAPANEDGLVQVGWVRFQPGGFDRPIEVTASAAGQLRRGDPFEATADLGGPVRVRVGGAHGELVRILADEGAASIRVNDGFGRALVRLLADSTGASLRVRGKDGRAIVSLDAGQGGFFLSIDTSAAH